ncbi:MAG: ornithine cyclodeaminase family protein [Streptosporangiaceae bacterium]
MTILEPGRRSIKVGKVIPVVRVLGRQDVQQLISMTDAISAVRDAFVAADQGRAVMPPPLELRLPEADGELHVKGAYITGAPVFAVKTATGFYRNPSRGLPVSGGMTMIHDAGTGELRVLVADGGLLTELRTAAAGALAADLLARREASIAAVIGTGGQARYQLQALRAVRPIRQVRVWGRRNEAAEQYANDMISAGLTVSVSATAREAVAGSDVVVTTTSSSEPVVEAEWVAPGTHVTAVGSDMPHKQELDPRILASASKYVPDSVQTALASGELHHAVSAGVFDVAAVYGELGAIASGRLPGRTTNDELTVADLTGLGIQDAAIAALVARLAEQHRAGQDIPLGERRP